MSCHYTLAALFLRPALKITAGACLVSAALVGPPAWAQAPSRSAGASGLSADFSYARSSGNAGYSANAMTVNLEFAALPLALGLDGVQSLTDSQETSTQVGASAKWRVFDWMSVTAKLATANDELVNVNTRGLALAWNLHRLWQGKRSTRLELGHDISDYSLHSGASALSARIPQQRRTSIELLQGVTPDFDLYGSAEWYTYSRDPQDLARALISRKVRRFALASKLGNLTDWGLTLGAGWSLGSDWNLDLAVGRSSSVIGQNQSQWNGTLSYAFHPRASISVGYAASRVEALTSVQGQTLSPQQDDSTVEVGLRWLY